MASETVKDTVSYPYSYDMVTMITLTKENFDDFLRLYVVDEPWMITEKEAEYLLNRHNKVDLKMVQHWEDEYWPRYGFEDDYDGPHRKPTVLDPRQKARFLLWRYSKTHDYRYLIHRKNHFNTFENRLRSFAVGRHLEIRIQRDFTRMDFELACEGFHFDGMKKRAVCHCCNKELAEFDELVLDDHRTECLFHTM